MSRFYADIQGQRGPATRQGSAKSGMHGHVRGWNVGARVSCYVGDDGEDHVQVTLTSGSNGGKMGRLLGDFTRADLDAAS